METKTLKYIAKDNAREHNTFLEEYYSSPDVKISIGGNEEEISDIQFSVQEQIKPLYGYNSPVFDDVAVGNRIIVGSLTIPIKNITDNDILDFSYKEYEESEEDEYIPGWVGNVSERYTSYNNGDNNEFRPSGGSNDGGMTYSDTVKKVQKELLDRGYNVVVNGFLDNKTIYAITQYQEEEGLIITGTITNELLDSLFGNDENKSTIKNDATMYSSPSKTSTVIGILNKGVVVEVISKMSEFTYIKSLNRTGYIESKYI